MTPGGLVQLAEAPPQGLQLALVPTAPLPPSPGHISARPPVPLTSGGCRAVAPKPSAESIPVNLSNQPVFPSKPLPPTFILQPLPNPISSPVPSCPPQPPPKVFLPHKGTVRADPADPPPFRRETLQFDPSLMFLEPQSEVCDWLSGQGGVVVPGAGVALPYLPPFVSSLKTLSALLRAKNSLTKSSLQLLSHGSKPRHPQTKPRPDSNTEKTSSQPPPDLPDSTSDLRPDGDQPGKPHLAGADCWCLSVAVITAHKKPNTSDFYTLDVANEKCVDHGFQCRYTLISHNITTSCWTAWGTFNAGYDRQLSEHTQYITAV